MEKNREKKNVIWNMLGATFNSFNSLFFTIMVTRWNGLNDAGIFTYAFATACVLYNIGIYEGRAFQVTDITGKNTDTDYLYHRMMTCMIMLLVSAIFVFIKGYDLYKMVIFLLLCVFRLIEAFAEVLYGVVQKNGRLYQVGISLFAKAVLGIICFAMIDWLTKNLILAISSVILVNVLGIILYDRKNIKQVKITKSKFDWKANNQIFKAGFFTFILTFLSVYLVNASRYAIDDLSTNDLQTIFGIIIMPATFMGLMGQYIIQPALTKLSSYIKEKQYLPLKQMILKLLAVLLGIGIFVFAIAYFLEAPVLGFVYGMDLTPYFVSMMLIIFGSFFYASSMVLSMILIAMRTTFIQAVTYGMVSVLATMLAYQMVQEKQILGASITYTVSMIMITTIFLGLTIGKMKQYKKLWNKEKKNENINCNSNI